MGFRPLAWALLLRHACPTLRKCDHQCDAFVQVNTCEPKMSCEGEQHHASALRQVALHSSSRWHLHSSTHAGWQFRRAYYMILYQSAPNKQHDMAGGLKASQHLPCISSVLLSLRGRLLAHQPLHERRRSGTACSFLMKNVCSMKRMNVIG